MRNMMTVKDIFALRKQGKIEEAYEAIRPIYKEHKGKFTTLCMFWVASDVFKLRLEQKRIEEAEKIYKALQRLIPSIEDDEKHSAAGFMHYAEGRLIKASEKFRKRYFAIKRKTAPAVSSSSVLANSAGEAGSPVDSAATVPAGSPAAAFPAGFHAGLAASAAATVPVGSPAGPALSGSPAEPLNKGQQVVLDCIKAHPGLKVPGLEAETGIPAKSIERHIKVLIERNLIEHRGSKKTGGYHAL